jgi:D-alanyl-D-alanine dipeptidase
VELSTLDYSWVLHPPVAVPEITAAPIGQLVEPDPQPRVLAPRHEPLVEVRHRRIRPVPVYAHVGWPHACEQLLVRSSVAERLAVAAEALPNRFGLVVLDAWRPLELQQAIFDAAYSDPALPPGFVSEPSSDPATPPPHLSGGTVDVSLTFDGRSLRLGTDFDAFTDDARADAFEHRPGPVRDLRRLLVQSMRAAGFVVIDCEWWHFEFGTRRWAAIHGVQPWYGPAVR